MGTGGRWSLASSAVRDQIRRILLGKGLKSKTLNANFNEFRRRNGTPLKWSVLACLLFVCTTFISTGLDYALLKHDGRPVCSDVLFSLFVATHSIAVVGLSIVLYCSHRLEDWIETKAGQIAQSVVLAWICVSQLTCQPSIWMMNFAALIVTVTVPLLGNVRAVQCWSTWTGLLAFIIAVIVDGTLPFSEIVQQILVVLGPNIVILIAQVEQDRHLQRDFSTELTLVSKSKRTRNLLRRMVLPDTIDALQAGKKPAMSYQFVTVLFADVVDGSKYAADLPPQKLVSALNHLFSCFDAITEAHGLLKVETVGMVYMAVAGVPDQRDDHAVAAASLACDLIECTRQLSWPTLHEDPIEIQVGLHSGPVVGGVIGKKLPRFRLFGDTVNTASRMKSMSLPGECTISTSTAQQVRNGWDLVDAGTREVKGKGSMELSRLAYNKPASTTITDHSAICTHTHATTPTPPAADLATALAVLSSTRPSLAIARRQRGDVKVELDETIVDRNEAGQRRMRRETPSAKSRTVAGDDTSEPITVLVSKFRPPERTTSYDTGLMSPMSPTSPDSVPTKDHPTDASGEEVSKLSTPSNPIAPPVPVVNETDADGSFLEGESAILGAAASSSDDVDDFTNIGDSLSDALNTVASNDRKDIYGHLVPKEDIFTEIADEALAVREPLSRATLQYGPTNGYLERVMRMRLSYQNYRRIFVIASLTAAACVITVLATILAGHDAEWSYTRASYGFTGITGGSVFVWALRGRKLGIYVQIACVVVMAICTTGFFVVNGVVRQAADHDVDNPHGTLYDVGQTLIIQVASLIVVQSIIIATIMRVPFLPCMFVLSIGIAWYGIMRLFIVHDLEDQHRLLIDNTPDTTIFVSLLVVSIVAVRRAYDIEAMSRRSTLRLLHVFKEMLAARSILCNLLPPHVMKMLRGRQMPCPQEHRQVVILFSDIVGFTSLSATIAPLELVHYLDELYTAYDEECDRLGLVKIETIGDAYWCCSPLEEGCDVDESLRRMVAMSFAMHIATARVPFPRLSRRVQIRIGIHLGTCVGGIVGTKMPRYHLFGNDVRIAEQMEQNGVPDKTNVSDAAQVWFQRAGLTCPETTPTGAEPEQVCREMVEVEPNGRIDVSGSNDMSSPDQEHSIVFMFTVCPYDFSKKLDMIWETQTHAEDFSSALTKLDLGSNLSLLRGDFTHGSPSETGPAPSSPHAYKSGFWNMGSFVMGKSTTGQSSKQTTPKGTPTGTPRKLSAARDARPRRLSQLEAVRRESLTGERRESLFGDENSVVMVDSDGESDCESSSNTPRHRNRHMPKYNAPAGVSQAAITSAPGASSASTLGTLGSAVGSLAPTVEETPNQVASMKTPTPSAVSTDMLGVLSQEPAAATIEIDTATATAHDAPSSATTPQPASAPTPSAPTLDIPGIPHL